MMRRSRISLKPNFRPGNRPATEAPRVSQGASEAGDTLPAEEGLRRAPSPQHSMGLVESSEGVGCKEAPEMPSEMNQNDGAPSSGATTSSAASQRRMRISATPKLVRPKRTSTPQTQPSASLPSFTPSPLPNEKHLQDSASEVSISKTSDGPPESGTPKSSTSPSELPPQSPTTRSPSPSVPSTSGLRKRQVRGKKSVEDSPPSPQPGQVPQQPSQEPEAPECLSSSEPSPASAKSPRVDRLDSSEMTEKSSDKDLILRALKLKELMKLERRKDIQMRKKRVGHKVYTALDRSKMTMRDLIYYLPNTSPMRSSAERAENQDETVIPPSPKQQIKTAEMDDDEEEESENEVLVPKVRVAEDGSIILDEDSLTVRVERTSNTKVVENSMALFECGFTTTYSSFREASHVKSWSVRETDLFFLAISMVGTDFTLIGQLLTHRSRKAIKNKFKKEEKVNPWRVDKALRNKRPYDKEFFSYLLEKVLAKDKDKRKSVRLILPKTKKPRKSRGKKANEICVSDDDDDADDGEDEDVFYADDREDLEHDGDVVLEKENKDVSNVKEDSSVPAKKRRKRTRDKEKDKDTTTGDQVQRKRQRCSRKTTSEVHSRDDTEGESDHNVEGETTHENKDGVKKERSTAARKRRLRHPKSDDENQKEKPAKGRKGKQLKKSLKVACDHNETVGEHEESSIITNEDGSATKKKRKRGKNSGLDGDEPAKEKKKAKRQKALKSAAEEEGSGDPSADLPDDEKSNTALTADVTAEVADNVPPKATRRSKKALPNVASKRSRKSKQPEASAEVERESQEENNHESILTTSGSPLQDERLQMQAVVLLEKTPPRQQHLISPSSVQRKNNELETPTSTPASPSSSRSSSTRQTRMQRAGRVKRDLSSSGKTRGRKGMMDQEEAEESPLVLLESIVQESEEEQDDTFNENLIDLSCLHDLDSQMFQRRPMVVLSREEVDMVLNTSDQSADEDPSVSPLDLSLNTELSFPLQCSKLLEEEEEEDEEAEVDCEFEAHEERTNESAPCEERNCEELDLTLGQTDISNLRDISTPVKPEVCSQPDVDLTTSFPPEEVEPQAHPKTYEDVTTVEAELEGFQPLVLLDNENPVCMKPDAPMTQETVTTETATLNTSLVDLNDVEKSEKTILKLTSLKESASASSEITAQANPTPTEGELGSQRSLQATPEVNGELQMSSQTLETLQDSSENKEGTQESAMASSEIKARIEPEVRDDSQEEVSVQSSASVSSEHGIMPTRRSKFLPKPNLSQKSRPMHLQNQRRDLKTKSSLKPKTSEPSLSVEKPLCSTTNEQHEALGDLSKQNLTKEEETSQPDATDQMESESAKDLCDASTAVPDQYQENVTTVTLSPATANEPQLASEYSSSRCDVDMIPSCSSLTFPQPSETKENTGSGQMIVPCKDVCAQAEVFNVTEDSPNDEEPTFILTLYEIPVTQAYTSLSYTDLATTSDLPTFEKQPSMGFSDQAHTLPSASELSIMDPLPTESNVAENLRDDSAENGKDQISAQATSHEVASPHPEDEGSDASAGIPPLDPHSECNKSSESAPLDDLAPRIQSIHSGCSDSKCITALSQDSEQRKSVSHIVLGDVPVSEEMENESSKDRTMDEGKLESKEVSSVCLPKGQDAPYEELIKVEFLPEVDTVESKDTPSLSEEKKAPGKKREGKIEVKPQPKLVKRAHAKDDSSETDQLVEEPSQPTRSHVDSPASHDETLAGPSNTTNEKSLDRMSSVSGNQTTVSEGKDVKPNSITEESTKTSQDDLKATESEPITTSLHLSKQPEPDEENSDNVTGDITVKEDMENTKDNELSISTSDEGGNVQPGCEDMPLNLKKTSGSGSSTVDSKETETETEGVCHMVLPDVFVFVSGETDGDLCDDCTVSIESSPQRVSLPESGADLKQELKIEDVSQTLIEESTPNQSPLLDIKTKRAKQRAKRTGTKHESTKTSQPTSSQLTTLPENEDMVLLEEKLQRRHHITPCTIRLSRLDTVAQSLSAPQLEDRKSIDEPTVRSPRTCHANMMTLSEESRTPSLFAEIKLESPELKGKSPTRSKGKLMTKSSCPIVSHMVLADVFVPVSECIRDDSSKDQTMAVESKLQGKEVSLVSVTESSVKNIKQQTSSDEPILLETKNKKSDSSANLETDISLKDPDSECEKGSEFVQLGDKALMTESNPSGSIMSASITTLPQDTEDTEQCEGVSHTVLGDVFVPVSEEMGDDSSKDKTSKVKSKEIKDISSVSLPERQDSPYEELTEVENSSAKSNPLLCLDSTEDSKDTPSLSVTKKAPARRRERRNIKPQPRLVKRARAKGNSSETDQLVEEPSQPTPSHVDSPASHVKKDETLAGPSNTTNEKSLDRMSSVRGNQTTVSEGKDVKCITEESTKTSQDDLNSTESEPITTSLYLSKQPEPDEENSDNVTGDITVKEDMESSTQDKESSISTSDEGGNVQPGCEDVPLNLKKTSGSGSSTVDSKETETETEGVCHMVLPDVFVFVSGETDGDLCDDCTVSIESSPQRVSLPESGADLKQELKIDDVSQTLIEESTPNQSPLLDIKTKKGKQRAKRTGTKHESTKTSQPTSSQLTTLPENEDMVLLEEKLQRRHHITPCTIRLSSADTVDPSQLRDRMSSLLCHESVTAISEESITPSRAEEMKLEEPELEKKSPTRRKGKKNESSPKRGLPKPVQTASHSRQLTITDWVNKKLCQTATNQKEEECGKSSQMISSLKTKEVVEKTCSKSQHTDSEEVEDYYLAPALEEMEEASSISEEVKTSSKVTQGSTSDPSVSPVRQRAKQVRSKRTCTKHEDNTSTINQPKPTRFTSPTRQHTRAAREKEMSDNETKQPIKEVSDTSSMEADSKTKEHGPQSPKSQDIWPRVVLSNVMLQTTESGVRFTSSAPPCSPARMAESSGPPVTPPQLKKSPTQSSSPTTSESPKDPSTVSQFFLYDIFTEVEEAE